MSSKTQRKNIREATKVPKSRNPVVRVMKLRGQKAGVHASNSARARRNKYACRGRHKED